MTSIFSLFANAKANGVSAIRASLESPEKIQQHSAFGSSSHSGGFRRGELIVFGARTRNWPHPKMRRMHATDTKWPNSPTLFDFFIGIPLEPTEVPFRFSWLKLNIDNCWSEEGSENFYEDMLLRHSCWPVALKPATGDKHYYRPGGVGRRYPEYDHSTFQKTNERFYHALRDEVVRLVVSQKVNENLNKEKK